MTQSIVELLSIPCEGIQLQGELIVPANAFGIVLFAHGGGSSRLSAHNHYLASILHKARIGTFLLDLLTYDDNLFDCDFLAQRLVLATRFLRDRRNIRGLPLGYFAAGTGTSAALLASVLAGRISAIVSRGGLPDLVHESLGKVTAPTLLVVGGEDVPVMESNRRAYHFLRCDKAFEIVSGATHHFEESGALEKVADLATDWFRRHFAGETAHLRKAD
jgi:putative phosphoribosyl transferase